MSAMQFTVLEMQATQQYARRFVGSQEFIAKLDLETSPSKSKHLLKPSNRTYHVIWNP